MRGALLRPAAMTCDDFQAGNGKNGHGPGSILSTRLSSGCLAHKRPPGAWYKSDIPERRIPPVGGGSMVSIVVPLVVMHVPHTIRMSIRCASNQQHRGQRQSRCAIALIAGTTLVCWDRHHDSSAAH